MVIDAEVVVVVPRPVKLAVLLLWVSIASECVSLLFGRLTGAIAPDQFTFSILFLAAYCLFPYKISRGSGAARKFWAILTGFSYLVILSGGHHMSFLDYCGFPIDILIAYGLFCRESSVWFAETRLNRVAS